MKAGFILNNALCASNFIPIYRQFKQDENYKIFIIISYFTNPVKQIKEETASKTLFEMLQKYDVKASILYLKNDKDFQFISKKIDILFIFLPYFQLFDANIKKLRYKICYIPYGISVNYVSKKTLKYFIFTFLESNDAKNILGKNDARLVVSGLPKFDIYFDNTLLVNQNPLSSKYSKQVLILEHHTLTWQDPSLSNKVEEGYSKFLKFQELYRVLPSKFPSIKFIFRPHPLLFERLIKAGEMTQEEIDDFIRDFSSFPNAQYQDSSKQPDYIMLFINSDGLISSGISSLFEFLPSGKPVLFLQKSDNDGFNDFGKALAPCFYRALTSSDIIDFLERVIIDGKDSLKETRSELIKKHLFIPEGGSAKFIKNYIEKYYINSRFKRVIIKIRLILYRLVAHLKSMKF
jgi:hypothetical protein